jgi:transposase InsO family protein
MQSPSRSTSGPAKHSAGKHPPKPSPTSYSHPHKALLRRPIEPGNYTSHDFSETLRRLGIQQSVGRTGICYDNAQAETFFASLKNERVHRTQYPTRAHARADIGRYIEIRYNTKCRHLGLGYRTPSQVHDEYLNRQHAA